MDLHFVRDASFQAAFGFLQKEIANLKTQPYSDWDIRQQLAKQQKWRAAALSVQQQDWLQTDAEYVLISDDTLIKQILHHGNQPVYFQHYLNLQDFLDNALAVVRSRQHKGSVVFFRQKEKLMKAVLKTTRDGKEVYLSSLYVSDEKSLRRELKKADILKNEHIC